jgi:hypothetical protein
MLDGTYGAWILKRDEVGLVKGRRDGRRGRGWVRCGVSVWSTTVAQHGQVGATCEASGAKIRVGTDPVVGYSLICVQDEGVPLAGKDLDLVYDVRLSVDAVDLDDGQLVAIDREREVRVAGKRNKANAIACKGNKHGIYVTIPL